eukprot:364557-Chlamydomonas_euryale.AAC.29
MSIAVAIERANCALAILAVRKCDECKASALARDTINGEVDALDVAKWPEELLHGCGKMRHAHITMGALAQCIIFIDIWEKEYRTAIGSCEEAWYSLQGNLPWGWAEYSWWYGQTAVPPVSRLPTAKSASVTSSERFVTRTLFSSRLRCIGSSGITEPPPPRRDGGTYDPGLGAPMFDSPPPPCVDSMHRQYASKHAVR